MSDSSTADPRLLGVGLTPSESALLDCQLAVLHQPTYAKLCALEIRGDRLSGRDTFDALHVEAVCFLSNNRFEFARNLRDATGAKLAVIIPARDEGGAVADLVAWDMDTDALATWR